MQKQPESTKIFISSSELAKMLEVNRRTVDKWRIKGFGPKFTTNNDGVVQYYIYEVKKWIKRHYSNK